MTSNILFCTIKPLQSSPHRGNSNDKKKRKRNIIWFNPPFSENVATNIGKEFFSLLSKHFPPNNRHHKIFNKQNVKLSCSCMFNMGSIIAQHNKQMLNRLSSADTETLLCNCCNKHNRPLKGKCRTKCVIYKASICTPNGKTMSHYGCWETDFKAHYYNHKQSFKTLSKRHQTELSTLAWRLKGSQSGHKMVHRLQSKAAQQRRYALPTVLGRKTGYLVGRPRYNVE